MYKDYSLSHSILVWLLSFVYSVHIMKSGKTIHCYQRNCTLYAIENCNENARQRRIYSYHLTMATPGNALLYNLSHQYQISIHVVPSYLQLKPTRVIEIESALVYTTASGISSIRQAPNNN